MSTKYKEISEVPIEVLADRLEELSEACVKQMNGDKAAFDREFTYRIPAELDRDPDLVLSIAATRLRELEKKIDEILK